MSTAWRPEREVEIVAGTAAGGGLDRTARALAQALEARRLLDVPFKVVNLPGDGARKPWAYLDGRQGDPHVLSISSPNLATDRLTGVTAYDLDAYTPLAILHTEYIAFVARADSPVKSGRELVGRLAKNASSLTFALSTALGNPNHIALAKVVRHAGGDVKAPTIRVFDSALDAVADTAAGNSDVAAVTAASAIKELGAGTLRVLAISAPQRLAGPYAGVQTWREQAVDCAIGAWRGIAGPRGLDFEHVLFWEKILAAAVATAEWQASLARHCWAGAYVDGVALRDFLQHERAEMAAMLAELGLLKR